MKSVPLEERAEQPSDDADRLDELLALLRTHGADFGDYRRTILLRRARSRMARLEVATLDDYLDVLDDRPEELRQLVRSMLVHYTSFFRDFKVFEALERHVLGGATRPTRAWAVGVATGEEAYSLAMLMASSTETSPRGFEVLGSDADAGCIEVARAGAYRLDALEQVPERFRRFVTHSGPTFGPVKAIRDRVDFVVHDLRSPQLAPVEAILAEFDLVLCRNVLLYLDDRYRALALRRLAAVVRPGGALVVGKTEALSSVRGFGFAPHPGVSASLGIFRKVRPPEGP